MAKKKFNIGMAALGALAGGMGGKYIFDKFGNKNPVAKKAAEVKANASSTPASEGDTTAATRNASPTGMAAGMKAERSVPIPESPVKPAPVQAQTMNPPPAEASTEDNTVVETPFLNVGNPNQFTSNSNSPGYRRGGMVAKKSSGSAAPKKGLSVRGGGKAVKGLGKMRVF